MDRRAFEELSAGHALHALGGDDEAVFRAALGEHPEWAEIVDRDERTVAALADGVAAVPAPVDARSLLLARIRVDGVDDTAADDALPELIGASAGAPGPLPTEIVQTVARRTWTRGILTLAASLVVLTVVGFGSAWLGGRLFPVDAETVALEEIQRASDGDTATVQFEGGGEATAYWSDSLGQAVIITEGVARLESTETYELWLIRDETPIAAGIFDVGDEGRATRVVDGALRPGDVIAVTVEPAGGSVDGTPSGPPVLVIPTDAA